MPKISSQTVQMSSSSAPSSATGDLSGMKRSKPSGFVMASVDDSLYHGCLTLKQHGLECLPLGDTSCSTALLHPDETGGGLCDFEVRERTFANHREPFPL